MPDLFKFSSSALPDDAVLLCFRLTEAINTPFELELFFTTNSPDDVDLSDAIGAKVQVLADRGGGGPSMQWAGVFATIEHVHQGTSGAVFRGLVVPAVWFLAHGEHSRIFTQKSVKDFATEVMTDAGMISGDFEFRLQGSPATEELVCQYRESDLAFITRWLERDGLFYFFEHGDDGSKMVITDTTPTASLRQNGVPYFPSLGHDVTSGEAFQRFRASRRAALSSVKVKDYDYAKPKLDVSAEGDGSKTGSTKFARFGDRFFTPTDGDKLAKTRAKAALAREEIYLASGTPFQLRTGYQFELENHPRSDLNKKYFATRIEHVGVQVQPSESELASFLGVNTGEVYRVEVEATDAALPYCAPRVTPWPRISGQEVAIVDGPVDGDHYAQLDDDGRYLVTFMFDENSHDDGKASTRVRMMQPHAGNPEGFHFPLRKGTEVVIIFLGGDPDRPLIAGAVPNALTPSPVTAKNHTRNIIITGSKNLIEIEDLKGKEWIDVSTPALLTDLHMGTAKDWKDMGKSPQTVPANYGEHTDGTAARSIGGDQYIDIHGLLNEHVHGTVQEDYDDKVTQTYTGPKKQTVTNLVTETFSSGQESTINDHRKIEVTGTLKEHVTAKVTEDYDATYTQTIGGASTCHWNTSATHDGPLLTETFATINRTGTTTNTHYGHWTHDSGVTGWTFGPLTVNSGTMTWTATGNVTVTWPNFTNNAANWVSSGFATGSMYVFNLAYAAICIQGYGLQLTGCAVNMGIGGLNITIYPFYLQNAGFHIGMEGAQMKLSAMFAYA